MERPALIKRRSGSFRKVALALALAGASSKILAEKAATTYLGERSYGTQLIDPGGAVTCVDANDMSRPTRYVRVRLSATIPTDEPWRLTVRDGLHRPVQVLAPDDFTKPTGSRWTIRVPGSRACFDWSATRPLSPPARPTIRIEEWLGMPADRQQSSFYSSQGKQPRQSFLYDYDVAQEKRRLGDYIAILVLGWDRHTWCCSGVAVGENLLLTNWHCGGTEQAKMSDGSYWDGEVCRSAVIDLSWDKDDISRDLECTEVVAKNKALDYALLRVRPSREPPVAGVRLRREPPAANEWVEVVSHPDCVSKQISKPCRVVRPEYRGWMAAAATEFTHRCDTDGGSSGGGVFSQGKLLGLHHLGFKDSSDETLRKAKMNAAVRMDKIIAHLRKRYASEATAIEHEDKVPP